MARLNDHAHTLRCNRFLNCVRDLPSEPFLDLQAPRKHFDEAGNLAEAEDFSFGYVSDVYFAEEGQHVVLTQGEHLDVLDDHHLVVVDVEHGTAQNRHWIFVVALGQEGHRLLDARRRIHQSVAADVLAEPAQNFAIHLLCGEPAQSFVDFYCSANRLANCNRLRHCFSSHPGEQGRIASVKEALNELVR